MVSLLALGALAQKKINESDYVKTDEPTCHPPNVTDLEHISPI